MFASFRPSLAVTGPDRLETPPGERPRAVAMRATPGYFEAFGQPLLRGRGFTLDDRSDSELVEVISRGLARQVWGDDGAVGRQLLLGDGGGRSVRIVGVAGDLRGIVQAPEPPPLLFLPLAQDPTPNMSLMVRTASDPETIFKDAEEIIWGISRDVPVFLTTTLEQIVADVEWQPRFVMQLLTGFALFALVLAATGIFAVLSYEVAERRREISLRVAAVVRDQQQLSRFTHHLGCNLSKEVGGRIRRWRGAFWERRYDAIVVSDEPESQWARLRYLISHSVKEQLCETPLEWPGVHCARALVHGEKLEGYWFHRSKEWAARRRGQVYGTYDYATRYLVGFAPLPAFRELSPEEYQEKIAALVREIEQEGEIVRDGNPVAGIEKILRQDPYEPPTLRTKRSPRPLFHAKSREARADFKAELDAFLSRYWSASETLRSDPLLGAAHDFPFGCYPPALAFVGEPPPPRPPAPPTRLLVVEGTEIIERGEIPVVEVPVLDALWAGSARGSPRSGGQPP